MSNQITANDIQTQADVGYYSLEAIIRQRVASPELWDGPIFTTEVVQAIPTDTKESFMEKWSKENKVKVEDDLFELFLKELPFENRQHYNCRCCRRFVNKYMGLVKIMPDGTLSPTIASAVNAPKFFEKALSKVWGRVFDSRVNGVFINDEAEWGWKEKGGWSHLSGTPRVGLIKGALTAQQAMAQKTEDFKMLRRALSEIPMDVAVQAVKVLSANVLDRSEVAVNIGKFFLELHTKISQTKNAKVKDNLIWLAVATAPAGFCHIRSSMIGTMLEDIQKGFDFETILKRWNEKMHPLQYQRPTTISEGVVEQAEKVFEKMGAAESLKRRFARLEDIKEKLWQPQATIEPSQENKGGLFDSLKPKTAKVAGRQIQLPPQEMSWKKFAETHLQEALSLHLCTPISGGYFGLTTCVNENAPFLFKWSNHVCWYFYHGGSMCTRWGLNVGTWSKVNAICYKPSEWSYMAEEETTKRKDSVFLILEGAKDQHYCTGALFFPENFRSEYHGVRKVIESYSNKNSLEGIEEGNANGYCIQASRTIREFQAVTLKVKKQNEEMQVRITHWE